MAEKELLRTIMMIDSHSQGIAPGSTVYANRLTVDNTKVVTVKVQLKSVQVAVAFQDGSSPILGTVDLDAGTVTFTAVADGELQFLIIGNVQIPGGDAYDAGTADVTVTPKK